MRHFLAVTVLGASLTFTATAALADTHDGPMFQPTQGQTIVARGESMNPVVAGGGSEQHVWNDRENGGNR